MQEAPMAHVGHAVGAPALRSDHGDELTRLAGDALDFANALRAVDGRPPVDELQPGQIRNVAKCPIACTAEGGWWVGAYAFKLRPQGVLKETPIPSSVKDFMAAFDAGAYPELVER